VFDDPEFDDRRTERRSSPGRSPPSGGSFVVFTTV
jgi:hypothetical protein